MQQQDTGQSIVVTGRMVWGGVTAQVKKNYQTKQPVLNEKGEQVLEYVFGLAIPKPTQGCSQDQINNFNTIMSAIATEGAKFRGQIQTLQGPNGPFLMGSPGFAWKFVDGDGPKIENGQPTNEMYPEYYKGCVVVACKTSIPLKLHVWENGKLRQVMSDEEIKCGYWVQVSLNVKGHPAPNAGVYINPGFVARFAYGEEIVNTPDPSTVFGTQAPALPPGASAMPVGNGAMNNQFNGGFGGSPQQQVNNGQNSQGYAGGAGQSPAQFGQNSGGNQGPQGEYYGTVPQQFQPNGSAPQNATNNGPVQHTQSPQNQKGFQPAMGNTPNTSMGNQQGYNNQQQGGFGTAGANHGSPGFSQGQPNHAQGNTGFGPGHTQQASWQPG